MSGTTPTQQTGGAGGPHPQGRGGWLGRLFGRREEPAADRGRPQTRRPPDFPTLARKLTRREETALKISEGLGELSRLMRAVGDQLQADREDRQETRAALKPLRDFLAAYPRAAERTTQCLEAIHEEVREQRRSAAVLLEKLGHLPEALEELPALGREQVTLLQGVLRNVEEHNRKLTEVLATVESATSRGVQAVQDLKTLQEEALQVVTRSQQETYREFDRIAARQRQELARMIHRTNRQHAVLTAVFLLVTLCAVSLAAFLTRPGGRPPMEASNVESVEPAGR